MLQYAAKLPLDGSGDTMQDYPAPILAKARYGTQPTASSVVTLTDNTTVIDICNIAGSGGSGLAIKWIASTDTQASVIGTGASANFDHVLPPNWRQRFVVPIEKSGTGNQSVVGINVQNGLYKRIAWIAVGTPPASVLASEF